MSQEPWNEEVYQTDTTSRKKRLGSGAVSTRVFTVLALIFFVILLVITVLAIYLSTGGGQTDAQQEFYSSSSAATTVASSTDTSASSVATESTTEEQTTDTSSALVDTGDGTTLTVQAGEGLGQLAARGGISIAELERLNPEKMTTGSWLAHPGDVVRIR